MPLNNLTQAQQLLADSARRKLIIQALARQGQHGDTVLAHLEPQEAAALQAAGGAGTMNPRTGLPQFYNVMPPGMPREQGPSAIGNLLTQPEEPGWTYGGMVPARWRDAPIPAQHGGSQQEVQPAWPSTLRDIVQGTEGLARASAGERTGMSDNPDAMSLATGGRMSNQMEAPLLAQALRGIGAEGDPDVLSAMGKRGGPRGQRGPRTRPAGLRPMTDDTTPPPPAGHNMPPEALEAEPPAGGMTVRPFGDPETEPPPTAAPEAPAASRQRGSITDVSLRQMPPDEALRVAQGGQHLRQDPKTGQFYGAPRGIDTPEKLQAMRDAFDQHVQAAPEGRAWYDRSQAANLEMTGDEPARSQLLAHEKALFSSQATPETNLGFGLTAHNAYEVGAPLDLVHTGAQAEKYLRSRAGLLAGTGMIDLGPKTQPYQEHVDPTRPNPTTSVNDIWHARAFGYTGNAPGKLFDRAPTAQEHAFMDAETLLAAHRANQNAVGGHTDWTSGHVQAAAWVGRKAQQLIDDREADRGEALGKAGDDEEAQAAAHAKYPAISMEQAVEIAKKDYGDYLDKHTAAGTYEQVPGAGTGHLPSLATAPYAERAAYGEAAPWTDPQGYDRLYRSTGFYQRPSIKTQGYFTPTGSTQAEVNPAMTARPMIDYTATKGGPVPSDVSQGVLNAVETTRAYMDAQNMGASHKLLPSGAAGQMGSATIPLKRALTPEEMTQLGTAVKPYGLSPSDTGRGVSLLNFGEGPTPKALPGLLRGDLGAAVRQTLPEAGSPVRTRQFSSPVLVDKDMNPLMSQANEGTGTATRALFAAHDNPAIPSIASRLDTPELQQAAYERLARDEAYAAKTGDPIRADIQNARRIIARSGLAGLRQALAEGKIPLPAVAGLGIMGIGGLAAAGSGQAQAAEPQGGNMPAVNTEQQAQALLRDHARRQLITQALASQGRGGDTMLAHLSPQEAMALKLSGGVGTRNPSTGIPQFYPGDGSDGAGQGADEGGPGVGHASDPSAGGAAGAAAGGDGFGGDGGGDRGSAGFGGGVSRGSSFAGANLANDPNPDAAQGNLAGQPKGISNQEAVDAATASYKNRGFLEKLGEFLTPGLEAQAPDITKPSTYMHDTWHTDINPGSLVGGIAGGLIAPGAGMITGPLMGRAYNALGLPDIPTGDWGAPWNERGTPGLSPAGSSSGPAVAGAGGGGGFLGGIGSGIGGLARAAGGMIQGSGGPAGGYGAAGGGPGSPMGGGGGGGARQGDTSGGPTGLAAMPAPPTAPLPSAAPGMGDAQKRKIMLDLLRRRAGFGQSALVPMTSAGSGGGGY